LIAVSLILPSSTKADEYGVILIYHKFDEPKSPSTSIPLSLFEKQMRYLKENGYNVVSLEQFVQYLKKGVFPPKTVAITIDDGYRSTMKAFKVLKKYNFPFTVFLYMEAVARYPDFLTKEDLKRLKSYKRVTFAVHSYSHHHFGKIPKDKDLSSYKEEFITDTKKAEERFLKLIGYKPRYYAYPYGDYNNIIANLLKKLGYKSAFTQDPSSAGKYSPLYAVPRQPVVGSKWNMKEFKKILNTEHLPIYSYSPSFGVLKKNPFYITAKIKNPQKYTSCSVYISEHGWKNLKKEGDTLKLVQPVKVARWKNRIGFKCFNKKTKRWATFFYMVVLP